MSSFWPYGPSSPVLVDGDKNPDWNHGSCTATQYKPVPQSYAWMAVDLTVLVDVTGVNVTNRGDGWCKTTYAMQ